MSDRARAIERLKEARRLLEGAEQLIVAAYKVAPKSRGCYADATEHVGSVVGALGARYSVLAEIREDIALWLGELGHTYAENGPARSAARA